MSGNLNKHLILTVRTKFEEKCVQLLFESHKELIKRGKDLKEEEENAITVQLIGLMKKNPLSYDYKIDIVREYYLDADSAYEGIANPDKSPRIDVRLMSWTSPIQFEYFFEAKNLYENDFVKNGNISALDSKHYQKRYIETGIQNFINGKYPHGCLVGYILEGCVEKITDKINTLLELSDRSSELLSRKTEIDKVQHHYESNHKGTQMVTLAHYFLTFDHSSN